MEINTVVTKYIPDKPKVLANEQIEVYVPTANYNYPGMASFDTNGFIVDAKGKVKLRRNSVRNVSTFDIDPTTGECTVYYDDGTVATISFPVTTNNLYKRQGLMTTIDVKPTSFVEHVFEDGTKVWLAAFSNAITGFDDDKFIVSLEERGDYTYRDGLKYEEGSLVYEEIATKKNGYFTIMDTVFKSNNGSVLISIENEADKDAFDGRLLLLGGSVFTDTQIVSITYNKSKQEIHILKSDGSTEIIGTVTSNDIDEVIAKKLSTVYYFKGSVTFNDLPTQEVLDKGDLIGATWYVTDAFVTDARFREGYGLSVPAGTNIAVLKTDDGDYKYDVLGSLIDLTDYVKRTDIASDTKAGVVKINNALGIRISSYGALYLDTASDSEIANQKGNAAIKVDQTPQAVKSGLTKHDNVEWTDEDKAKACDTIGAATPKYVDDAIANAGGSTSGISLEDWEFTLEDGTTVTKKVCVSETGNIGGIGGSGSGTKLYQHKMRVSYFAVTIASPGEQYETENEQNIVINSVMQDLRTEDKTSLDYSRIIQEGEAYRFSSLSFIGRLNGMDYTRLLMTGIAYEEGMYYFQGIESQTSYGALVVVADILSYEVTEL